MAPLSSTTAYRRRFSVGGCGHREVRRAFKPEDGALIWRHLDMPRKEIPELNPGGKRTIPGVAPARLKPFVITRRLTALLAATGNPMAQKMVTTTIAGQTIYYTDSVLAA